jgi:poly(hydroxyalkanoate) granule-associated protein
MLKKARAEAKSGSEDAKGSGDDLKDFAQGIRGSSRQIWLAGLGAFSRAQAEGMKMFETLVEQGQNLESRTRRAASETATAAAGIAAQKAKEMHAMAGGTWDKLEQVFEDRVARALGKLGVHTQADVDRLARRVEALSEAVNELIKAGGGRPVAPAGGAKKATRRAPRARKAPSVDAKPAAARPRKSRTKRASA